MRKRPRWRSATRWRATPAWWCSARTSAAAASSASTRDCRQSSARERVIDTPICEGTIAGAGVGMALAGLRPVVEMRVVDFALCAMDEIVNQAAKNRFMFGGQGRVPLVLRMPIGIWAASAAQHSQTLEAWFAHLPGVVVVCPATPQDNHAAARRRCRRRPGGLHGTQGAVGR